VCFLALEMCLGYHVVPSILVLAHDWLGVCHLDYTLFSCIFSPNSPAYNIHQHLWNLLVITPTTNVDAYLSNVYAGIDGLGLVLKSRQQ
jgi:hypothetical protein